MSEINRSLVILNPRQPFLDWVQTLDDEDEDLTLEQLAEDSTERGEECKHIWATMLETDSQLSSSHDSRDFDIPITTKE